MSILSLLVAGFSLLYVRQAAKASREQIKQQKQAAKDAAQPMLWVDIRGDDGHGQALVLLLGNSGPSIARNVKVVFDPAPPAALDIKPVLEILKKKSPSPRCRLAARCVDFGCGADTSDWDGHKAYRIRMEAEGPSAPSSRSST